ncbi:hypothetical protein [Taylorella equigenitalis]|uniref:Uncharacterized protein n=2 Tax=Taylorella equigenitalis TaxID=29575 RepID=A0A654KI01_TAYEM|nr:hypothetical protein [Taylorella equigenitalis]ADU92040.1 hypothetical protein TEQUI_1116 [Taylorella equigenitalis MCE9]AFN35602.1 putative membrane protein [Taylorella equigenitalis ATCC 35865]WDU49840.1 hypothetical protein KNO34_02415 [Taylorella equigenitalis]WDU52313.1 hypothetical protein KNO32_02400 [Taylorella equigenitalis]WDU53818.1 hypothetical protein KNO31_02410 [Taylorella equigenitalis]
MKALNNFLMLMVGVVVVWSLVGFEFQERDSRLKVFIKEEPSLKMIYNKN